MKSVDYRPARKPDPPPDTCPCAVSERRPFMEHEKLVAHLSRLSEEDAITGLLNRRGGEKRINEYMAAHPDEVCAFLLFDGDHFKKINDSYGHLVGDHVIVQSGPEIKRRFSDKGIVFRLGGDEFVVFYTDTSEMEVRARLEEFRSSLKHANAVSDINMPFTFSVGISMTPDHGTDFDELMKGADIALYNSKYEGRGRYRFYEEGMEVPHRDQFMFALEEFAKGMPGGFFVYEAQGDEKILYASDSLAKMFKCKSVKEFRNYVGNSFRGIVHPDDLEKSEKEIAVQQFESPENENRMDYVRYRIICKDGTVKTVDDFGHLVMDPTFGPVYYVYLIDLEDAIFSMRK